MSQSGTASMCVLGCAGVVRLGCSCHAGDVCLTTAIRTQLRIMQAAVAWGCRRDSAKGRGSKALAVLSFAEQQVPIKYKQLLVSGQHAMRYAQPHRSVMPVAVADIGMQAWFWCSRRTYLHAERPNHTALTASPANLLPPCYCPAGGLMRCSWMPPG